MKWISVKDKLPKESGKYLTRESIGNGDYFMVGRTFYDADKLQWVDYMLGVRLNVTYWMEKARLNEPAAG
jgi:hypothetical protein